MPLLSQPVQVLPRRSRAARAGLRLPRRRISAHGTPGALGDTWHGLINAISILPRTSCSTRRRSPPSSRGVQWARVTQNEAVFKGRSSYLNPDGSTPIDKVTTELRRPRHQLHADLVPGMARRRFIRATVVEPGSVGHLRRGARREQERRRRGAPASRSTSIRSIASISSTTAISAITRLTSRLGARDILPNGSVAALSDRGWVSLTFKTTF